MTGRRTPEWELVVDGFGRLEAPCFDAVGRLCFSDMRAPGAVHRLEPDGRVTTLHDRSHVGGMVPHADGGLVATGSTVAVLTEDGTTRVVMEHPVGLEGGWGFNDLTTDSEGNVYVGMHGEVPTGGLPTVTASLWRIAPGGVVTHCYDGIQLTNGIGISPDGARLYHNDTAINTVWVSDLDDEGLPHDRRPHHVLEHGSPDGMTVDEEGGVWIAAIGAGVIVRVAPDGDVDLVLDAPRAYVASACFGGDDGRDLYCVTFGGDHYDSEHSGGVFRTRVDVAGAPITPARV